MYMKILDILIIVTGSILPIIISIIGLVFSALAYNNTKRKNSIDQLPYFDIDNLRITINYGSTANKFNLSIPLINIGNGMAMDISTKKYNDFNIGISYDTATKGYYTYFNIEKNISLDINDINFEILFSDLEGNRYSQNFSLKIFISNIFEEENKNFVILTNRDEKFFGPYYYFFLKERKTNRPVKL